MDLIDVHSHKTSPGAIYNLRRGEMPPPGQLCSAGIHPWEAGEATDADWQWLAEVTALPEVVAVGEAGLDKLRGAEPAVQQEAFLRQIQLSEQLRKPLIIHQVRSHEEIIRLARQLRPSQPWIIHGFRQRPEIARRLLDASPNILLSFGPRFNPETVKSVPLDRLLAETDDDPSATIADVISALARTLALPPDSLSSSLRLTLRNTYPLEGV